MHPFTNYIPVNAQLRLAAKDESGNHHQHTDPLQAQLRTLTNKLEEAEAEIKLLKALNHSLSVSEKELIKGHGQKDKFFSILSHDLKGPLHTLSGFLGILKVQASAFTTQELEDFAHSMDQSVGQVLGLLTNLLQWSLSQSGNITYTPACLCLHEQIASNMALLSQTAKLKGVHLQNSVHVDIQVQADKDMLNFILRNLLSNAIKFSYQTGQIEVKAELVGPMIAIRLLDKGVGMREEDASKMFESEQHFSTPGTANEKGTGLGLLLCQEFVSLHQGSIKVESKQTQGTCITFTLPSAHSSKE